MRVGSAAEPTFMDETIIMPFRTTSVSPGLRMSGGDARGPGDEDSSQLEVAFGISSLATVSIEEIGQTLRTPKLFQLYPEHCTSIPDDGAGQVRLGAGPD